MLIPDLIIQLIAVVIGVALYATIFKILKNIIYKIIPVSYTHLTLPTKRIV